MPTTSVSIDSFEITVSGEMAKLLFNYETTGDTRLTELDFSSAPEFNRSFAVARTYLDAARSAGFAFSGWSHANLIFTALFKRNVGTVYDELRGAGCNLEDNDLLRFKINAINRAFTVWFSNLQSKQVVKQPLPWGLGYIFLLKDAPPEFNLAIFDLIQKGAYIYNRTGGATM